MPNGNGHKIYRFDGFSLDAEKLMLYRDEREIALPPKVVKTLAILVENKGEILSKDELIEAVWSDSVVEESNLSQYLYLLRKTLGNTPDGQPYIETLRRRGYRFTGDAHLIKAAPERPVNSRSAAAIDIGVERSGNVLRVVEWPSNETVPVIPEVPAMAATVDTAAAGNGFSSSTYFLAAAIGTVSVGLLIFTIWWFRAEDRSHFLVGNGDLNFTRLTSENYVHDATVSRDGNYFAYSERAEGTSRIWIQQTGQAGRVEIVPAGKWTHCCKTFSPDGKFLYFTMWKDTQKPDLYRVPTLGGNPEKVLGHVSSAVSFSPDGSELTFLRREDTPSSNSFVIAPSNGRGAERRVFDASGGLNIYSPPAWSPDRKRMVFAATAIDDSPPLMIRLYTLDLETGITSAVSDEVWGNAYRIEWLRDGTAFAMVGTRQGETLSSRRDQVYLISYPDGRSRRLTTDGSRHEPESLGMTDSGSIVAVSFNRASQIWSVDAGGDSRTATQLTTGVGEGRGGIVTLPDGRIGYSVLGEEGVSLWMIAADGSDKKRLLPETNMEMISATPDGRYIIFRDRIGDYDQLYRVPTEGGGPMPLTFDQTDTTIKGHLSISPDGLWVAYDSTTMQNGTYSVSIKKVPIGGGEPVTLVDKDCRGPEYSPDGRYIACSSVGNRFAVRSASDGALVSTFDVVSYSYFEPKWAPDSQSLVYIVHQNNVCNLWKQPINGGKAEPLTDFTSGQCHNFAYSRDGSRIYLARGYEARDAILISFNKK